MSLPDLVESLRGMLMSAAEKFHSQDGSDFERHLEIAARDLARVRRRTLTGSLTLVADQANYSAPADILEPKIPLWGTQQRRARKPWNSNWLGRLPTLRLVENAGNQELWLDPAPTAAQIADLGSTYDYFYFANHVLGTDPAQTTVSARDRPLLIIRAAAHSLQELANNNYSKPVTLGDGGVGSMPKNGTAAALSQSLMSLFERMAA